MSLHFWTGFAIGAGITLALALLCWIRYQRHLISHSHSHHRTPIHVRGRAIYLVPEDEYVRDTQLIRRMGVYLDNPRNWTNERS